MSPIQYPAVVAFIAVVAIQFASPRPLRAEELVSVKGTVTLDGKPLPGGRIFFFSEDDQFVGSKIKAGTFKVDRVAVGEYKVIFESMGIPATYSSEDASPLRVRVDVRASANAFSFTLKSN